MAKYTVPIDSYDAFKNAVNGKGFDLDGYAGYQCWDGVQLFYSQLNATLYTGSQGIASECWTNTESRRKNTLDSMVQITNMSDLKRGDIIVLNHNLPAVGNAGHIAFCDQDFTNVLSMNLLGQNQGTGSNPTTGKPFNVTTFNITSFLGAFRYLPWNETPPVPPKPEKDRKKKKFPWGVALHHWYK